MTPPVPLLLLHPFPLDAGCWAPVLPRLAGRPVLAPDFPGFGAAPEEPGWTIAGVADRLAGDLARGPGGAAVVCGVSMGGYTALALAARHPDRVAGLLLADTRAEADDDAARDRRREGALRIAQDGPAPFLDALLPQLVAPDAPAEVVARVRALADRQPPTALISALGALAGRPDRVGELAAMATPALVVVGEHDRVTPIAAAETMATGLPDARLEVIPRCGHLSVVERPEALAALLAAFLAEVDARGAPAG
jgi:pimeloyl-ACP methyl ester carboxylesterase